MCLPISVQDIDCVLCSFQGDGSPDKSERLNSLLFTAEELMFHRWSVNSPRLTS